MVQRHWAAENLGYTALLLGDELTAEEKTYIAQIVLPRSKVGAMTGQNRVWLATNGVMRGALLADDAALRQAADVIQTSCAWAGAKASSQTRVFTSTARSSNSVITGWPTRWR